MKRTNPLFVDSSKQQGEIITTQVELKCRLSPFGEKVHLEISQLDENGLRQTATHELFSTLHGEWQTELELEHQKEITYRFVLTRMAKEIEASVPKTVAAGYYIHEVWQPTSVSAGSQKSGLKEIVKVPELNTTENSSDYKESKTTTPTNSISAKEIEIELDTEQPKAHSPQNEFSKKVQSTINESDMASEAMSAAYLDNDIALDIELDYPETDELTKVDASAFAVSELENSTPYEGSPTISEGKGPVFPHNSADQDDLKTSENSVQCSEEQDLDEPTGEETVAADVEIVKKFNNSDDLVNELNLKPSPDQVLGKTD